MTIELNMDNFKTIMAACSKNVSADKARILTTRICLRVFFYGDEGKVEATALDGYAMITSYCRCYVASVKDEEKAEIYHEFLLEPVTVPRGAKTVKISDDADGIKLTFDTGMELVQKTMDGKYIDYPRLIDGAMKKEVSTLISVDPKLLARILNSMKDEKAVTMRFTDSLSPILIDGLHTRALVLPVRKTSDGLEEMWRIIENRSVDHE